MTSNKNVTILHLTDFHVLDIHGDHEYLRKSFYREYILGLIKAVKANNQELLPEIVVVTGDFIENGTLDNYSHVADILQFLADQLHITTGEVFLCCGNQDIVRDYEKAGEPARAREAYYEFSKRFGNGKPIVADERAVLLKTRGGVWCLMLDATHRYSGKSGPGVISSDDVDVILNKFILDQNIPTEEVLIIGAHYPAEVFPGGVNSYEEPGYHEKHYWSSATPLRERIKKIREGGKTLWLYGDIHCPDQIESDPGFFHVVTGRFGTSIKRESQIKRQAKVIEINETGAQPKVLTLEFEVPGHHQQGHYGTWKGQWGIIRSLNPIKPAASLPAEVDHVADQCHGPVIDVVDPEVEKTIIDTIKRKNLYTLGRYHTSDHGISLGWVSIGPLLNHANLLASLLPKMSDWMLKQLGVVTTFDDAVLIGIDCWGAVLASQLSVSTGIKSYCIAARGRGKYHTTYEKVNREIARSVEKSSAVFFISDVLATGKSINDVFTDIDKLISGERKEKRWISLSLFMDELNQNRVECPFIETYGTACKALRMPVLPEKALPDVEVLPPKLTFS